MKKVLVVMIVALALLSCSVTVFAADKGLNATYYQNKGIEEGNTQSAILGNLGSTTEATGNFEANKEALFESLQEMGTIVVDTFEVEQNDEDWRAQAEEAGCVLIGDHAEGDAPDWFVVKYTGYLVPNKTAEYTFGSYYVDNGLVIYIDNQMVFEFWGADQWIDTGADDRYAEGTPISLEAGKAYPIEVYYYDGWGGEWVEFEYGMGVSDFEFYVEEPTAEDIAEQMKTPEPTTPKPATPTPTKAPVPTKAPNAPTTSGNNGGSTEPAEFPWWIIAVVVGVVVVVVVVVIIVASKKKKA